MSKASIVCLWFLFFIFICESFDDSSEKLNELAILRSLTIATYIWTIIRGDLFWRLADAKYTAVLDYSHFFFFFFVRTMPCSLLSLVLWGWSGIRALTMFSLVLSSRTMEITRTGERRISAGGMDRRKFVGGWVALIVLRYRPLRSGWRRTAGNFLKPR